MHREAAIRRRRTPRPRRVPGWAVALAIVAAAALLAWLHVVVLFGL